MELRSLGLPQHSSDLNLKELQQVTVELTTPEGHVYKVGRLSNEERAQKILKYVMSCKLAGRLICFMWGIWYIGMPALTTFGGAEWCSARRGSQQVYHCINQACLWSQHCIIPTWHLFSLCKTSLLVILADMTVILACKLQSCMISHRDCSSSVWSARHAQA